VTPEVHAGPIRTHEELESALARLWWPTFPWHRQQELALNARTDTIVVLGGNQSGKTQVGVGIVARLCRREGPIYARLQKPNRPLKIWIAPLTGEKWRSNWEPRLNEALIGLGADYAESPHPVYSWTDQYGENTIWGKSQEQGYRAFEGDPVDLVILDEEPDDQRIFTSCKQRFATTNGVLVFTFTPLLGMDWSYEALYEPTVQLGYRRADRLWVSPTVTVIQMGMADNPAAVDGATKLQRDPTVKDAEKKTRLYGEYGFVEGLMFPTFTDLTPYFLPRLPDGRPYTWTLTADPNKRHAGVLTAVDHENNRFYVAEHYVENRPDIQHAKAYQEMLATWHCPNASCHADPGGAGAQAIINMAEQGVFFAPVPKDAGSVKASIDLILRAAWIDPAHQHPVTGERGAPHTYFCGSLWTSSWAGHVNESRLVWELQRYRQKPDSPPGTPIKKDDDCTDCIRYHELVRPFTPTEPDWASQKIRERLDDLSWKERNDSERILAKMARGPMRNTGPERDIDYGAFESDLT
jgi:phage terminase large subunit-like protein